MSRLLPLRKDPVCGTKLDRDDIQARVTYQNKVYCFCSLACKQKFEQAPHRYEESGVNALDAEEC